jgi:hypothetical protein
MATRFVELNQAAEMLGITPEQLVEMRSNGEIHGYRDGPSWKFKAEEIERVAGELKPSGGPEATTPQAEDAPLAFDDVDDLTESPEEGGEGAVLVSEEELGHSGETTSSTVIGDAAEGSDLSLAAQDSGDLRLEPTQQESEPLAEGGPGVDSDVTLVPGVGEDTDVSLVPDPGSDKQIGPSDSEMEIESSGSGGTGRLEGGSDMGLGSSDLDVAIDSELALSDDDEVVLGGSGIGSDLTLGAADSGINLSSPSDSGLSLEADSGINLQSPTDSGLSLEDEAGSSSISNLELPEEEEVVDLEETQEAAVKGDEKFQLSPPEDMFGEESDSGSQVIALEESGAFEEAGVIQPGEGLLEETSGLEAQLDSIGAGAGPAAAAVGAPYAAAAVPEAPYSVWNVLGLLLIVIMLSLSGILMTDIVQNMWAWEGARDVSTSVSEGISSMFGE